MIGLEGGSANVKSSRNDVRGKTLRAVHYYNENVLKVRNSQNLRLPTYCYQKTRPRVSPRHDNLYRSNSSLELLHDGNHNYNIRDNLVSPVLKREYGSHGSIDIISSDNEKAPNTSEQFFAMLQGYQPAVFDLRNADKTSTSKVSYPCRKADNQISDNLTNGIDEEYVYTSKITNITSPKQKSKLTRFWGTSSNNLKVSHSGNIIESTSSQNCHNGCNVNFLYNSGNSPELDEKQRRRAFAHYDCQSVIAKIGQSSKLKLSKRKNTTTGASAASMTVRSSTPDGDSGDEDSGDGRNNDLLESCPFFRNEIGGEEERVVSLTRSYSPLYCKQWKEPYHKPTLSGGISILEFPVGETHWKNDSCPYRRNHKTIENVDEGALYYRKYFYTQDHQNWFGFDDNLGPVAISIKREKADQIISETESNVTSSNTNASVYLFRYRLIVRTSELQTLRGSVFEDAIPNLKASNNVKNFNAKEVLEYVVPEVPLTCLRLGVNSPQIEEQLLKLDEQGISRHYKVGILYCRSGQSTEEEMYNNEDGGPAFNEFLETIGQKVRLKGFDKYRAGLDNKSDSTGFYSVFAHYQDCEVMFHVSTLLPFTPNNRQQLLRKRHIGNDIVTIVFQEPGAHPFTPKNIRSQFQHVFIIVRAIHPCSDRTQYSVAVTRSRDVALFGPPIPKGAIFNKSKNFADFLLAKGINAENAAHRSEKFATMATRTRQAYLKDLTTNCATSTVLETSQKFSMLSFSSKKKDRWKPRFTADATQRGAICWQLMLEDSTQSTIVHCLLALSADSLVLIDETTNNIVFVTPCKSILGWSAQSNSLRLYYHEGECITIHMRESGDRDELMEVVARLRSVTNGAPAQEFSLKRNSIGQLGFHVQPDGVVTQVENMGLAWQAGLRQGARLVEICKVAITTLSHDQMVDLLKTSLMVTVTVIPSLSDGSPRRGCMLQNCKSNCFSCEGDYDTPSNPDDQKLTAHNAAALQKIGNHRKMYERSFSPPRSCNSSGYGTGSSSKSFSSIEHKFNANNNGEVALASLSSGNSGDDRWYDMLDMDSVPGSLVNETAPPPPLPVRLVSSGVANSPTAHKSYTSHSKIKTTHSLPLSNMQSSYSLPILLPNDSLSSIEDKNYTQLSNYEYRIADKAACLIKAEHSHEVRRQLEHRFHEQRIHNGEDHFENRVPNLQPDSRVFSTSDGHSTDTSSTSERAFPPSEDELSVGSGNASPRIRSVKAGSSGNLAGVSPHNGSRNNSPRSKPDTGEPRLRPGITVRSSNRNSANLTASTLQQDLMKLINLDYSPMENNPKEKVMDNSFKKKHAIEVIADCKSDARIKSSIDKNGVKYPKECVIDTNNVGVLAPSIDKVIGSTSASSSPLTSSLCSELNEFSKDKRSSPQVTGDSACLPLPDTKEMDWPSLVDTATKAMLQVSSSMDHENVNSLSFLSSLKSIQTQENSHHWMDGTKDSAYNGSLNEDTKGSQQEFQKYMSELEKRLMKETQKRLSLEQEVHSLRDENQRLQQESQSAAQQLRRFTEWFFQTIDKR